MNLLLWVTVEILIGYALFRVHPYLSVTYALLQVRQMVVNMIKQDEMEKKLEEIFKKSKE